MARKTKTVIIQGGANNRDRGKQFLLTEMDAESAEWWALRVLFALGRANPKVSEMFDIPGGMGALASAAGAQELAKALVSVNPFDIKPMLDEMMRCVSIIRDPKHPEFATALLPEDIEEITTRFKLRGEVFYLHVGFSIPGSP